MHCQKCHFQIFSQMIFGDVLLLPMPWRHIFCPKKVTLITHTRCVCFLVMVQGTRWGFPIFWPLKRNHQIWLKYWKKEKSSLKLRSTHYYSMALLESQYLGTGTRMVLLQRYDVMCFLKKRRKKNNFSPRFCLQKKKLDIDLFLMSLLCRVTFTRGFF